MPSNNDIQSAYKLFQYRFSFEFSLTSFYIETGSFTIKWIFNCKSNRTNKENVFKVNKIYIIR